MDLRSVLNTADNGERPPPPAQAPPTPQQQHQPRPSPSPAAQYGFRDYPQPPAPHPSPGKHMGRDFTHHPQQHPGGPYPPSPYQGSRQYAARVAPPQQQPPQPPQPAQPANPFHDGRSPGAIDIPAQPPYRLTPTPTSAQGGSTAGYPFPPAEVTSPSQRHQYPPGHYQPQQQQQQQQQLQQTPHLQRQHQHQLQHQHQHQHQQLPQSQQSQHAPRHQRRDSHPQPAAALGPPVYAHQQQTPPLGTPSSLPYLHQRSQSAHSTPTPTSTSAHGQHQFGPPHAHPHGSPVAASKPFPAAGASPELVRQLSQPPTPLGPPPSAAPWQASNPGAFAQPPSPLQQRTSSAGRQQPSPNHPPPLLTSLAAGQRVPSVHSTYESPVSASDSHARPRSRHDREQSLSVSPRTRVASLASNTGSEPERRPAPAARSMTVDVDTTVTPAKRKLGDRSMSPRELENREVRPPPAEANGGLHQKSASPVAAQKRRVPRAQPPIWAQSVQALGHKMPSQANFILQKLVRAHLNGKPDAVPRADRSSRQPSPEAGRAQPASASASANSQSRQTLAAEPSARDILGPWEASITGVKPYEELSKTVADFVFIHVVNNPDLKEIVSRGIQFEIEAKLGTLIDKDTNCRIDRLLDSECVLRDTGRIAFRSSMTEVHHKAFNDFLNQAVIQTDPRAPNGGGRIQIHYKHRREIDRFFELPPDLQNHLPGCMRSRLGSRSRNVRVRVTYDQKTREVLNKIIKARVADIDLHMPSSPMDCRLSINLEMNWDGSAEELEQVAGNQADRQPERSKDRLSYTQGHYQVDLTQVTQTVFGPGNSQRVDKEHELEIELAPGIVLDQGSKAMNGTPHRYSELIEGLVDNVRVLARKARDFNG